MNTDLFGNPIIDPMPLPPSVKKRRKTVANGYAAAPGTGPKGETCKTCDHYRRIRYSKAYLKCGLAQARWTHGTGTDIKGKSPACNFWQKDESS